MATNLLNEFVTHIKRHSIARSNRFRVSFTLPEKLRGKLPTTNTVEKIISLTCLIADVPSIQEQTTTIEYGNTPRKVAFDRTTGDFPTTFLVTGNYIEKKLFDAWHSIIFKESESSIEFYDDYVANITVDSLNEQDQVVYSFTLTEAYPLSIGTLKLDRTAQNSQMVLDVNWAYHRIKSGQDSRDILEGPATRDRTSVVPGLNSAKQRLFSVPGLDTFTGALQTSIDTVNGLRGQLKGVLDVAASVKEQVRDAKMAALDGVKVLNGVILDVKAISNIPVAVKNEVVSVVTDTRNQLGSLKRDLANFKTFPKR